MDLPVFDFSIFPAWLIGVLAFIGTLHLTVPAIQGAVEAVVRVTSTKKDDEIYDNVVKSPFYSYFLKFIKYVSGLNLDKKKK